MVVSGLVNLSQRGVTTAMLYVDAHNEAAMRLYNNLGFRIHRTDRAFVGDVPRRPRKEQLMSTIENESLPRWSVRRRARVPRQSLLS